MMDMSEIALEMTFDAGHRIVGHEGKCARLHGHTYKAQVRAAGPIRGLGFVVDFGDIKEIINQWDHRLLLWEEDRIRFGVDLSEDMDSYGMPVPTDGNDEPEIGVIRLPFNPTAENMAQHLASEILHGCDLLAVTLTLWETPNASATAFLEKGTVMA